MKSQNWDSIRGGVFPYQLQGLFVDSVHDQLIVSSRLFHKVGSLPARGICSWNGSYWDSLQGGINTDDITLNPNNPHGTAYCGLPYNGKLLVGGIFNSIGGVNATSLATWDGTAWDSLPVRAFKFYGDAAAVYGMYRYNNLIYLYGVFDTIAGQPAKSLATWDGVSFQPVNLPLTWARIFSMTVYKNQLYIAGNFANDTSNTKDDILRFDGTNWTDVGGGIKGGISNLNALIEYNDTLFVGGWIFKSDGNAGDLVMKWDGSQWHDAGFDGASEGYVDKFLILHNKLWALGGYNVGAYMPAYCAASYDGTKWCALKDSLDNSITSATIYHDTIYVAGGFHSAGGDSSIAFIAKLKDPDLYRGCNATGINEIATSNTIKLFPNPATSFIIITDEQNELQGSTVEISNGIGQVVLKQDYAQQLDVSGLSPGCYFLSIRAPGRQHHAKFIKQ